MKILIILLQTINILLFGHSYGVDSTEYLPELAVSAGMENVYIGRFIKGNCSLEEHYAYFLADSTKKYAECLPGKTKFNKVDRTVREAVSGTRWDYVIFQNSLENEGRYETAQPWLNRLVEYVLTTQKECFDNVPVIGWNMFWPISRLNEDGHHKLSTYRLSFYGNSSDQMWNAYLAETKRLSKDTGINFIIPTGTAVMNARRTGLNTVDAKELTRDGDHLSYDLGRYVAACAVYEKILAPISGKSVLGNEWRVVKKTLPEMTDKTATILQRCAVAAVEKPFKLSKISEK